MWRDTSREVNNQHDHSVHLVVNFKIRMLSKELVYVGLSLLEAVPSLRQRSESNSLAMSSMNVSETTAVAASLTGYQQASNSASKVPRLDGV